MGTPGFEVPKTSRRSLSAGNSSRELQSNFVSRGIIIITILGEQFSFAKFSKWMKIRVQRQKRKKKKKKNRKRMGDSWGRNPIKRKNRNKTGYHFYQQQRFSFEHVKTNRHQRKLLFHQ